MYTATTHLVMPVEVVTYNEIRKCVVYKVYYSELGVIQMIRIQSFSFQF